MPPEVVEAFFSGIRSSEIPFVINDCVEILNGPHAGKGGAVISILAMASDMTLLVELGESGKDVTVPATSLRLFEGDG